MISIDEHPPPDPSSSDYQNQQHQQVSHEALPTVSDIDLLKSKDATTLDDTNNPHPKFAIRDYVYGSRCKNIARNWPFSHKSLQLCLNHSVNNILPPFESLDSLRSNQSVSKFGVENHFPNEETVTNFNRKSQSVKSDQCHLDQEDLAHTKSNSQPTVKKYKLVMKLNSGGDPVEETVASSKVCPVCRTFSSSSNTTLNAHIDQCLSEESSMKSTANPKIIKTVKHRIKPRKTRLMVDIYKTAPHCTVEELDRRNGTSWATNSNFPDQEHEFQAAEEKKEEPIIIPKVADHEGAVYIDTNGTKVRILSVNKLDDDDNARKLQIAERGSKFVRGKKKLKAYGQKNCQKILKLSPNSKKLSKKVTSGRKENVATLGSYKKDGGENPMKLKGQANMQMGNVTITRPPWACSKRTGIAKKRFPVSTKPKEGTRLYDSSEDPSLIIRSKGCKFSSLKKNVLESASREHNNNAGGSKLNLKRKFSALKKPQDSWKQNPRMEKINVNVSEVKKRSNGNEDSSSGGVIHEITTESAARIQVPIFHSDDHVGIDEGNNLMGLRKYSLDDEFSKIVGQPFDPRILDEKEEENELEVGVEPLILIPGPPGCFLPPSPGADDHHMLVSEEEEEEEEEEVLQAAGNSSLTTTSRVHDSNEDHHDLMKTDFISDSPVSTVSSSPSFARSCTHKLSSRLIINSQQNKKSVKVNSSDLQGSSLVDHPAISFTEKTPSTPTLCCCSRKEGEGVPSSYHQPLELNRGGPYNFMPDLFSLKLPPPPPPETVKSPSIKLPDSRDRESAVLRLMGKNLTVVRTTDDDDDDGSFKPPAACSRGPPAVGQLYQNFQLNKNDDSANFLYGHHHHHHHHHQQEVMFSHNNQNWSTRDQPFNNLHPSNNNYTSGSSLVAADLNMDRTYYNADDVATKEIIIVDDHSLELKEGDDDDHHMFKESSSLIRKRACNIFFS